MQAPQKLCRPTEGVNGKQNGLERDPGVPLANSQLQGTSTSPAVGPDNRCRSLPTKLPILSYPWSFYEKRGFARYQCAQLNLFCILRKY